MSHSRRSERLEAKSDSALAELKNSLTFLLLLSNSLSSGGFLVAIALILMILRIKFSLINLLYRYICWLNAYFLSNKRSGT